MNKINAELLAPAGSFESLEAALRFGADAVYIGGPFMQLRAESAGFSADDVRRAAQTAHRASKRLYVAVNCFARNDELAPLADYAAALHELGVDAAIVSDLGALRVMRRACPALELHVSTQANVTNYETARLYYELGAKRIVLAREATVAEIREIRANIPPALELECFVHGAMCMSYSGQCLISSYLNGRSGNRGECTQPCRWHYKLLEEKRPGVYYDVIEEDGSSAILSSHDLCCIDMLDELADAGVCSFKIEGRMKTAYYVATVTNAYRCRMDGLGSPEALRRELNCVSHRPYSTGFYYGVEKLRHANDGNYTADARFTAVVTRVLPDGRAELEMRNRFADGETLEVLTPGQTGRPFTVRELRDEAGEPTAEAYIPCQRVTVSQDGTLRAGDLLRRAESE